MSPELLNQKKVEQVTKVRWADKHSWKWGKVRHRLSPEYYVGNQTTTTTIGTVSSTIQAAGNITGNVSNLSSTGINSNQVTTASPTSFQQSLGAGNTLAMQVPTGSSGLFVRSNNPQSSYLIERNPQLSRRGRTKLGQGGKAGSHQAK